MRRIWISLLITALSVVGLSSSMIQADNGDGGIESGILVRAHLSSLEEVPPRISDGDGSFKAAITADQIWYELTYKNLSTSAMAAHIHFAPRHVNGGVMVFLCGGGGKPACPASGTITGVITASDVMAVPDQGVEAGDLDTVIRTILSGYTYVNVHTMKYPGGEVRGQIKVTIENVLTEGDSE